MYKAALAVLFVAHTVFAQESFKCPHEYGFYPHARSCDKYWKCENNQADLKTCGNGLAFESSDSKYLTENCDYLHNVDCGDRVDLEPAISTPNCPRLYGIFPDETRCDTFWSCWNGEASKYNCAPGLAYDATARVCMWADQVPDCKVNESNGGYKCPDPKANPNPGTFSRHAHPEDCRKYYVCLDGNAREYGCPIGTVYKIGADDYSGQCEDPEGVDGCENYYGDELKGIKKSELLGGLDGSYNKYNNKPTNKPTLRKKIPQTQTPKPEVQSAPSQVNNNRIQQHSTRERTRPQPQPQPQQVQQQQPSRPAQAPQRTAPVQTTRAPSTTAAPAKAGNNDKASADDYYYYDENYDENTPAARPAQ